MSTLDDAGPLADPVAEARRLVAAAAEQGQVGDKVRWYQQPEEEGGGRP
jgi:hypothetical protein